jgi:hypothetical protein
VTLVPQYHLLRSKLDFFGNLKVFVSHIMNQPILANVGFHPPLVVGSCKGRFL